MISEISQTSGIGHNSVSSIISEYRNTGTVTSPNKTRNKKCLFDQIDDLNRNSLRQKVHSFWLRKELPTIDKILQAVNNDPTLPNFKRSTLHTTIKKLDFVFIKQKRCSVLTETEDLLVWRHKYLYDIRKYREEGRTIYYLDEMWFSHDNCVNELCMDTTIRSKYDAYNKGLTTKEKNLTGKGKRLIALHIASDKGFLDGGLLCFESKNNNSDERDKMIGDNFHEWFKFIISRLDPKSVIVMDNAPYHSVMSEKIPTTMSKNDEILTWLSSKGIQIDRPMIKAQLLRKVQKIKSKYSSYVVDNMAKDVGHTILRLPPHHCEFNLIESAWIMVKEYVKQHNTTCKMADVRALLIEGIKRLTSDNWKNFIEHVITEEDKMWTIDNIMDEIINNLEPCDSVKCDITSYDSD